MSSPNFQCAMCKHFHDEDTSGNNCDAYPDGIPEAIITNEHNHRQPYRGDGGIQFEKKEEV